MPSEIMSPSELTMEQEEVGHSEQEEVGHSEQEEVGHSEQEEVGHQNKKKLAMDQISENLINLQYQVKSRLSMLYRIF